MKIRRILFVCKYNRFRSRIACALFKKIKIRGVIAQSAGIFKGSRINQLQKEVCSESGVFIQGSTRSISTSLLKWQDTIVVVADDVPPSLFKEQKSYGKKLKVWKIRDVNTNSSEEIRKTVAAIASRVQRLGVEVHNER